MRTLIFICIFIIGLLYIMYNFAMSKCFVDYLKSCSAIDKTPYIPLDQLPEILTLAKNYNVIKDEVKGLIELGMFKPIQGDQFFDKSIAIDNKWKRFYLKWFTSKCNDLAIQLCPKTCQLISSIKGLKTCMFSLLEPNAYIPPHFGPYSGVIRYHLGIITPNDDKCFISIDGKEYSWRDGDAVLFDDTYSHYVKNETNKERIVMFCDFERPMISWLASVLNKFVINVLAPFTFREN